MVPEPDCAWWNGLPTLAGHTLRTRSTPTAGKTATLVAKCLNRRRLWRIYKEGTSPLGMSAADPAPLCQRPRGWAAAAARDAVPWCCATVEFQPSFISIDTFNCAAFPADAWATPLPVSSEPAAACRADSATALAASAPPHRPTPGPPHFARALQAQHARVREFLQAQRDRWRQIAAHFTRQIETLQAEVHALQATNEGLRAELSARPAEGDRAEAAEDASRRYLMAMDDIRDLKARNAELQRQLLEAQSGPARPGAAAPADSGGDWETQKRRLLAELESDDQHDAESTERRLKIEEIVARTDKIIAEKNREIEELQHLLNNQSNSLGSLALGAAALEQVLDQDAIIREERQRLQQLQDECRDKLRQAEIELAMERARLARRDAEIEEKLRNADQRRSRRAEAEALAPTGRPVRGRWRTQLGLTDDGPPEADRSRDRR